MPVNNQKTFNEKLYDLLKTHNFDPVPKDSKNQTTPILDADVFKIDYSGNDVWLTVDNANTLKIYYDDEVLEDENSDFTDFLIQMKNWAQKRQLQFEPKNRSHLNGDMSKRDYMKNKNLNEGYYATGKKTSYNDDIPQVKILIQHNRQIEEGEQRFRNIEKIFIENVNGEKFLIPTKRPGLAKVYARHIAEGGTPYDDKGKHITSLVEEYTKMAGFVRATRKNQFNESVKRLVDEGINHYYNLKETLTKMIGQRGYHNYFESYTPVLNEQSDDSSSLNELFVQETLDPRIESVLPILNRLSKNITEMSEVKELAEWSKTVTEIEDQTTKTLSVPASEMLDEAPGAETLAHNQSTEKKNLDAFDLEEEVSVKYEVRDKNGNRLGTWDGINFKSYDLTKYKHSDMIPPDSEVDKASGPVGEKDIALVKAGVKEEGEQVDEISRSTVAKVAQARYDQAQKALKDKDYGEYVNKMRKAIKASGSTIPNTGWSPEDDMYNKEKDVAEGSDVKYFYVTVDGKQKFKTKDGNKARSMAEDMKKDSKFDGKNIEVVEKSDYQVQVGEDLDANQKHAGQLGPTEKVGPKGAVGKLVGASESVELDKLKSLSGIK